MTDADLDSLITHLDNRREAVLEAWWRATEVDPDLTTGSSLPRTQFRDHAPHLLRAFTDTLRTTPHVVSCANSVAAEGGAEHGLQRWQQGYRLAEVTREWGHLHQCLAAELDCYALGNPKAEAAVSHVRRAWAELCWRGVSESAAEYHRLHRTEAAGQVQDLERALAELSDLDRRRAEAWREAAHDLRGSVGVVTTVAAVATMPGVPEPVRDRALERLQRNIASLQEMLGDLMGLARLEAGHEIREIRPFDAAALLNDICDAARPLAAERNLVLAAVGPSPLEVEGDPTKVRRIVQNLLLNAVKYTQSGDVTVSWEDVRTSDQGRWMFSVRDTGPGFHSGTGAPLVGALEKATASVRHDDAKAPPDPAPTSTRVDKRPVHQGPGEGVGLSIVKRLCELLDATLEVESTPAVGSVFRVRLPLRYDAPA
ncbi:MAG: histidine kinase [Planctomycetaceae bacterium]|nr:histidine kinase [Planctomycetaceae bacterium]